MRKWESAEVGAKVGRRFEVAAWLMVIVVLPHAPVRAGGVVGEPAVTIFRDAGRYVSFPDVKRLPDGRLICVFRDAKYPKRISHIDPDARVSGCLSSDGGKTWGKPFVVYDDGDCQQDPSLRVLRDGRVALNYFTWVTSTTTQPGSRARKVNRGEGVLYAELGGVYVLWGKAEGLTWDAKPVHISGDQKNLRATSSSMLETRGGVLLLATYGGSDEVHPSRAYVMRSTDQGKMWNEIEIAADRGSGGKIEMEEPALAEAQNGDIVAWMRTTNADDHLYQVRSTDEGRTWSEAERLEVIGHPADFMRLADGRLLVVYGYRHPPFGVRACVSADNGTTWDLKKEIVIADTGVHGDLGYPSVCMADEEHVLIAYYMNGPDTKDRWIECRRVAMKDIPR